MTDLQSTTPDESLRAKPPAAWRHWLPAVLLVALTVTCYLPSLRNLYIWDDDDYVTKNLALRSLHGLVLIWGKLGQTPQYYPLTFTTFWCEYRLWGLWAAGYHAVNIALHATSVVLLWRLLVRLLVPGALLAAAIFAVHPLNVESVAWITERKNVLSLAFALRSLICYLRFYPPEEPLPPAGTDTARWRWNDLSFALFIAALLSKSVTAAVPAVLLVIYWWKRGHIGWQDVQPLRRFFIAAVAMGLLTAWVERRVVGATGEQFALAITDRLWLAGRNVWFYAVKLAWPNPLIFIYPRWDLSSRPAWLWLYPLSAVALVITAWLARRHIGRGPLAALLIYGGVLVPVMGFLNVYPFRYSFVADHFAYHASIALIAIAAATIASLAAYCGKWARPLECFIGLMLLVPLCVITFKRQATYHDAGTLFTDTIDKDPLCWMAYNNLGRVTTLAGKHEEALVYFEKSAEIMPTNAEAWNNIGAAMLTLGRTSEARKMIEHAVELDNTNTSAQANLGHVLMHLNRAEEAIPHLEYAIRGNPRLYEAGVSLTIAYSQVGRLKDAIAVAEQSAIAAREAENTAQAAKLEEWLRVNRPLQHRFSP